MENLEIVLEDINKNDIDKLVYEGLELSTLKIKHSNFYDNDSKTDIEFSQVKSVKEVLSPKGTGNIVVEDIQVGVLLKNVVIIFSFDKQFGDVVLNFPEKEIFNGERKEKIKRLKKIIGALLELKSIYDIKNIILGYEPATDEDMKLIDDVNKNSNYDKIIEKII